MHARPHVQATGHASTMPTTKGFYKAQATNNESNIREPGTIGICNIHSGSIRDHRTGVSNNAKQCRPPASL